MTKGARVLWSHHQWGSVNEYLDHFTKNKWSVQTYFDYITSEEVYRPFLDSFWFARWPLHHGQKWKSRWYCCTSHPSSMPKISFQAIFEGFKRIMRFKTDGKTRSRTAPVKALEGKDSWRLIKLSASFFIFHGKYENVTFLYINSHYKNMPIQIYWKLWYQKMISFSDKKDKKIDKIVCFSFYFSREVWKCHFFISILLVTKTCLFKYTENVGTKKKFFFR